MRLRTRLASLALVVAAVTATLAACAPGYADRLVAGTRLTIAQSGPVTGLNDAVLAQRTAPDAGLAELTHAGFHSRGDDGALVPDDLFGSVDVASDDPLTVAYTVHEGVAWSDGAPVDAADLLLAWAAGTTHRTGGEADASGQPSTRWGTGAGPGQGLDLVGAVPRIGADGRSVTLVYDSPLADWRAAFDVPRVAAHDAVERAYPGEYDGEPQRAKDDLIAAVRDGDLAWLAPVSAVFREGYALGALDDPAAVPTLGPYLIDEISPDGARVALRADPAFAWGPSPRVERVELTAIADPAARVAAVADGAADLAAAPATESLVAAADAASLHSVVAPGTAFEHVDLQTAGGGAFAPAAYGGDVGKALAVREAFLAAIGRDELVARLVAPVLPGQTARTSPLGLDPASDAAPAATEDPAAPAPGSGDTAAAAALLARAGAANPTVRVLYPAGDARRAAAFALIAASAAAAGFTVVDASRADWAAARADAPGDYDAALFAWDADPASATGLASVFHTGSVENVSGWSDDQVDALVAEATAQTDAAARTTILADLDAAIAARAWTLPLFDVPVLTVRGAALAAAPASPGAGGLTAGYGGWDPVAP